MPPGQMNTDGYPSLSGELACGFIDKDDELQSEFVVQEMDGGDEDKLAGTGPVVPRMNQVILNCMERLGNLVEKHQLIPAVRSMTAVDRMILLISIRRCAHGDAYRMQIECSKCKADKIQYIHDVTLDLSNLKITRMEDPSKRDFESELKRGSRVDWHVMMADDEEWLNAQKGKIRELARVTLMFLCRVDRVNGVEIDRASEDGLSEAIDVLQRLKTSERTQWRNIVKKLEGDLDTEISYTCPKCDTVLKGELDFDLERFFFPPDA